MVGRVGGGWMRGLGGCGVKPWNSSKGSDIEGSGIAPKVLFSYERLGLRSSHEIVLKAVMLKSSGIAVKC